MAGNIFWIAVFWIAIFAWSKAMEILLATMTIPFIFQLAITIIAASLMAFTLLPVIKRMG